MTSIKKHKIKLIQLIRSKSSLYIVSIILIFTLSATAYLWFLNTTFFEQFQLWVQSNFYTFFVFLSASKAIALIYPPLPGSLFTYGAIPIIGWWYAYLADVTGGLVGASVAFYIGKKYGESVVRKIISTNAVTKMRELKIKDNRQVEAIAAVRIAGAGLFTEAICYGAPLLKVKYRNFILGCIIVHISIGLPTFYIAGGLIVLGSTHKLLALPILMLIIFFLYKYRGRYFE